jgi:hypothetical protein
MTILKSKVVRFISGLYTKKKHLKFLIKNGLLTIVCFLMVGSLAAQNNLNDTLNTESINIYRDYQLIIAPDHDLYNASVNSRTAGKFLHDVFSKGIGPKIKNNTLKNISEGIWSFTSIYTSMIWAHEFGHMLRAKQVGGNFTIERLSFPIIFGHMDLPPNHSLEDNALSVAGGFEVNYLTVRDIQLDLFRHNSLYNDELSLAFAHRLLYPIYFTVIAPVDPERPNTWNNTMGDPVHWIKPVWERSGNEIFQSDGSVNPELVSFYKRSALASVLWNLVDMNFYSEAVAAFSSIEEAKEAKYLIGDEVNGWGYGTNFNTSVLGAELYLTNYLRLKEQLYSIKLIYGFPFQNNGIGLGAYDVLKRDNKFNVDINLDVWDQVYYDMGFALSTNMKYRVGNHIEVILQSGYKTEGYLIGRKLQSGFIGNFGLRYKL